MKTLFASLLVLAGLASCATACDRQRILAIGGGCGYQQQVLGFSGGGCYQQAFIQPQQFGYVQQFAQPIYGFNSFRQPRLNINIGRGFNFNRGFRNNVIIRQRIRF